MTANDVRHRKKAFLAAFADCGSITEAAERIGMDRTNHYVWLKSQEYRADFEHAREQAIQHLEDIAMQRAKDSSDTLLIFLLKCRNRPVFGDRQDLQVTGKDGSPLIPVAMVDSLLNGNRDSDE